MTITSESVSVVNSDWWFIGLDETRHWNLPAAIRAHILRIDTVYAFNRNEHTYCCELTPSHWLTCVDFSVTFRPEFYDRPDFDELREQVDLLIQGVNRCESDCYMHKREIDRLLPNAPKFQVGQVEDESELEHQQVMDALFEQWHCNPKF
jgi:hypothetical protein